MKIEAEHVDELVTATRQGSLVWRLTEGGDAVAEDAVFRYVLDANGVTLFRIGKNPFDRETGGVSLTDELYVQRVLTPVVNSLVLPAVVAPTPSSSRSRGRRSRSSTSPKRSTKRQRRPGLKEAMPAIAEAAKSGRVDDGQLELLERGRRRRDPA